MERIRDQLGVLVGWWGRQSLLVRAGVLGVVGVLLGATVALALLSGDSAESNGVVQVVPTATPTSTATASPTATVRPTRTATAVATATPTATPEPTATPDPTIHTVAELVEQFGHPPGYEYARLRIPKLGVDAPVGASYVGGGQMDVPEGPTTAFWYDMEGWPGLGGVPGEGKNAIFSGHVDIASYLAYADVTYVGPGIFWGLDNLSPGDRIFVDLNGETLEYQVVWERQVPADSSSDVWAEIWSSDVEVDSITLYTCGGEFDVSSASYIDRLVLRAERV